MNAPVAHLQYMLIPAFCALTGYTEKAVRRKIADGKWLEGRHYRKAPDGHITMNIQAYYAWVEGGHRGKDDEDDHAPDSSRQQRS